MGIERRMLTKNPYLWAGELFDLIQEHKWILFKLKKTKPYEIFSRAAYISIANDKKREILYCIKELDCLVGYLGIISLYEYMDKSTNKPSEPWEIMDKLGPYLIEAGI